MPSAVPIRQDIPAAELRRCAKFVPDGRASRRMLALAAALEGASRADAAQLAGMDRQSLRAPSQPAGCAPFRDRIDGLLTIDGFTASMKKASKACAIARTRAVRPG